MYTVYTVDAMETVHAERGTPLSGSRGLRITGGKWRGRRLQVPAGARPTTERVREAIWGRWQMRVEGARVLELFAGSGAMSLEALSRGAHRSIAVERSVVPLRLLERNAAELEADVETVRAALPAQWSLVCRRLGEPVDLVFLDPPYRDGVSERLLSDVATALAPGGRVAVEHRSGLDIPVPPVLEVEEIRRYGETKISYLRQP